MSLFDANWDIQVEKMLPPVIRDLDFQERSNDFKSGDAENQIIYYLIVSAPGHWKQYPTIGGAISQYLLSSIPAVIIQRAIRVQLINDIFDNPLVDATQFPVILVNSVVVEL